MVKCEYPLVPIQTGSYKSKFGEKGTLPGTRIGMAIAVFRKHSTLKESFVWLTLNITSDTGSCSPAGPPSARCETDASCSGSRCSLEAGETESSETEREINKWSRDGYWKYFIMEWTEYTFILTQHIPLTSRQLLFLFALALTLANKNKTHSCIFLSSLVRSCLVLSPTFIMTTYRGRDAGRV